MDLAKAIERIYEFFTSGWLNGLITCIKTTRAYFNLAKESVERIVVRHSSIATDDAKDLLALPEQSLKEELQDRTALVRTTVEDMREQVRATKTSGAIGFKVCTEESS